MSLLLLALAVGSGTAARATLATPSAAPLAASSSTLPASQQQTFSTPEEAAQALATAWRAQDKPALLSIFGPQAWKLISSGDPVADRKAAQHFVAAYDARHLLENSTPGKAILLLGPEDFPYPIPLVLKQKTWHFDTQAGAEEILDRRIGRNELHVIEVCRELVEAQREYAAADPMGTGAHGYAAKIISSDAQRHDGLYWTAAPGDAESPLGPLVASAVAEGYTLKHKHRAEPYHGYFYRLIGVSTSMAQAHSGATPTAGAAPQRPGYAFIAFPAKYQDSGVMTFAVTQDGIVYEKNLGKNTAAIVMKLKSFSPDVTWSTP